MESLEEQGFSQFVTEATHLRGGHIDHAYIRGGVHSIEVNVSIYSPYYCARDHDAVLISLKFKKQVMVQVNLNLTEFIYFRNSIGNGFDDVIQRSLNCML